MRFSLAITILLWISYNKFTSGNDIIQSIQNDLKSLNVTCDVYDSCADPRQTDSLSMYACQCSSICAQIGTCCKDSQYNFIKPPKIKPVCRSLYNGKTYYLIDRCPESDSKDSVWESMCREEWDGEDDVMKIVPVTSLFTNNTYKNYYCFRCNELSDDFLYWNLVLKNKDLPYGHTPDETKVSLNYDPHHKTWVAPLGTGGVLVPVDLSFAIPGEIHNLQVACNSEVISHCSEIWEDKDMSDKCEAYMGVMSILNTSLEGYSTTLTYRNVHCALCNFEDLKNMVCMVQRRIHAAGKVPFSFTHLLDINRSDGDKVGKIQKCEDNFLWDPYAKICRKLSCALPGYVVKNGKCTPP